MTKKIHMKIGLQTWGSNGDIRPYIALAYGLRSAGHEVILVISSVENRDYRFFGSIGDFAVRHVGCVEHNSDFIIEVAKKVSTVRHTKQLGIVLRNFFDPVFDKMHIASKQLCVETDAVISHPHVYSLMVAAEKTNIPLATLNCFHFAISSRHLTPFGFPEIGKWINPFWWKIVDCAFNSLLRSKINKFRIKEGLCTVKNVRDEIWNSKRLNLIAVSSVFCRPQPDWKKPHQVCGFFDIPEVMEKWEMPTDLQNFIGGGSVCVYIVMGSMIYLDPDPEQITSIMIEAVELAGCRAIIQSRWDEIEGLPESKNIYRIKNAPHDRVFPYCSAVVHHGGAGTTHTATRHGCPSIVLEYFGDQPFWGSELRRIGIAPKVLHRKTVNAGKLAKAIRTVLDSPDMKKQAELQSQIMSREDGISKAVGLIENQLVT